MIKKIIVFLIKLSNFSNYIADCLRKLNINEEYYVYVPNNNKPKYIHKTYHSAMQEAKRLASTLSALDTVEILKIENRFNGEQIPF